MSGGNKKYSFYMSMGFLDQHGLLSVTDDIYQRFTPSAKITARLTDWMKATYSLRYNRTSYDRPIYLNQSLFADWARQSWPEVPAYDDNGYIYMDNEQLQLMVNGGRTKEVTDNLIAIAEVIPASLAIRHKDRVQMTLSVRRID